MPALRSDAEVRQEVVEALTRDVRVDASQVDVQVENGVVTLRGSVTTPLERSVASEIVRRVKGVRELRNELRVDNNASRSDAEIEAEVRAAFGRYASLDAQRILVRVRDGVVTLTGVVGNYAERANAEAAAWQSTGVAEVVNNLAIEPATARTDAEIAGEVRIDLAHNLDLARQKIQVEVTGGVVYLRGSVSSLDVKWQADEIAWWTTGVRDVINELTVGVM
ncbi:MAG TPA: BON domain-containing protein [Chloroflexota bacterium]|nr:BON domain-containing protein [Chloroflexota bacterium]